MTTYYKFTGIGRTSRYGATDYPPVGEWSESRAPKLCESGWHIPDPNCLGIWVDAELWEVEVRGKSVNDDNKSSHEYIRFVRQLRWTLTDIVDFARSCADTAAAAANANAAATDAAATDAAIYAVHAAHAAHAAHDAAIYAAADKAAAYAVHAAHAAAYAAADKAAARKRQSDWIRLRVTS